MKFDRKKIMPRYLLVVILLTIGGLYILGNALYLALFRAAYWEEVSQLFVRENVPLPATRGNILSADGQVMASSLPEYRIYMDFVVTDKDAKAQAKAQAWRDSVFTANLDTIAEGLHRIFPDKSAQHFKAHLKEGKRKRSRYWRIYPKRITYIQYKECQRLPLFKERPYKGGFYAEEFNQRRKPFGSLATRTLGALYAGMDSAKNGLELAYDSILRGTPGISHRTKVRDKWLNIVDKPPINGNDIETTIDVGMQDAAEKALVRKLKELDAELGIVVLMEVKTGDVKAIVNMTKCGTGIYREVKNNAVADLMEPGSTFKTASIMVALEDGKITLDDKVETGNGQWPMYRRVMKDHNWRKGGYGTLTVPEILMVSSNIGVSRIIDDNYAQEPEKYVDGLYRLGVGVPLNLPLPGSGEPRVRRPNKDRSNWYKTALPWMSIGYETQLPPIATVTFYNAIANNGRMVKPRFIRAEYSNGIKVKDYPVEVIKEQICSPKTLTDIQTVLEMVVSKGLGKKAGCEQFKVAGKTGTAQVAQGGSYKGGRMQYLISFCGYFPADAPKYSCIVAIKKFGVASGGGMCGPVFSEIAQIVMAKGMFQGVEGITDSTSTFIPQVLNGNLPQTKDVLNQIQIETQGETRGAHEQWGTTVSKEQNVMLIPDTLPSTLVPNVIGMGARDAASLLESYGLKVQLKGIGKVKKQSPAPNTPINQGQTIRLELNKK